MDPLLLVVAAAFVLVIAALVIRSAVRSMRPTVPEQPRTSASTATAFVTAPAVLPAEVTARIDRLVEADQRIQAIKVYRDHTGVGLREAKERIDQWAVSTTGTPTPGAPSPSVETPSAVRAALPADVAAEIDRLVAREQKISAIKVLREHAGLGLKESKDLIEAWPTTHSL
ncbi:ribosomal protein L7/L12 [Microbacterium sp. NPDC089696]|uniref:ribosomal protein L7/L12 n=1 Tax=Microbacterium sp. NPDC089696 TaxID=3364199 RepID=UPI0037FFCB9F